MKNIAVKGFERVLSELAGVEGHLAVLLGSKVPFVNGLGRFLHQGKGKRLRPALVVLFYKLLDENGDRDALMKLASILELIHLATLVHDDVIDHAQTRRNQATLHAHSSNRIAILEGDFLFTQVFKAINDYHRPTRDLVINTIEQILEGELLQESLRGVVPDESQYFEVTQGKTAVLIATACLVGAQWGDTTLSEARQRSIYEAGMLMGQAFQLVDDLLDVFGDEQLGKPRWSDARGGWLTLPLIQLLQQRQEFEALLLDSELKPSGQRQIQEALITLGIRSYLEQKVGDMLDQSIDKLSWLPESELRDTLFDTINFIARRRA